MCTEVWNAHKLLDYGFFERKGARLSPSSWSGQLPNPAAFNYTHYPLPMLWVYTLIYSFAGAWGVLGFTLACKLAGCIAVFLILSRFFDRFAAWLAAILFAAAPCSILLDLDTDLVAFGSLLWPVATLVILGWRGDARRGLAPWKTGLMMFVAGQVSWFALTLIPALMSMTERWKGRLWATIIAVVKNRAAITLLFGGIGSFLLFLAQVVLYEPDFRELLSHIRLKLGESQPSAVPKWLLFTLLPLRTVIFVGPALIVGGVVGLFYVRRHPTPLMAAAIVYLPSFAFAALVIPNYFYMENIVYGSMLFPAAVLTAAAIQACGRLFFWLLVAIALPGVAYIHLSFSVPTITPTARMIGGMIASHTNKVDVVLTNLEPMRPPYKSGDVHSEKATKITSDRHIIYRVVSAEQLGDIPRVVKASDFPLVFVRCRSRTIAPELAARLERAELIAAEKVSIPVGASTMAEKLRGWVWYNVMRKAKRPTVEVESVHGEELFEVYRLR